MFVDVEDLWKDKRVGLSDEWTRYNVPSKLVLVVRAADSASAGLRKDVIIVGEVQTLKGLESLIGYKVS